MFKFKEEKSGNSVVLTQCNAAHPDSRSVKDNAIKSVLTVMQFDDQTEHEKLKNVFYSGYEDEQYNQSALKQVF